jgi:hypothetical protein
MQAINYGTLSMIQSPSRRLVEERIITNLLYSERRLFRNGIELLERPQ